VSGEAHASFGTRALRGTVWTALRYAVESSLRLASNLILTRLLFPEAFGLMALVNVLMIGLAMFSDIGITTSVVQSPRGDEPRYLRTAWTLQVARGVVLSALAVALAGVMAEFYGQPELRALVPVAGLTALISGFNSMSLIRLQRHLQLGKLAVLELTGQLVSVALMIAWAALVPSVWALVAGGLVGAALRLALSYLVSPEDRLGFAWDRESSRQLLGFGKWIFVSTMLFFMAGQADRLIFGRMLSVSQLGVYGIALMLASLPIQILWSVGSSVLLPAFSRQAGSRPSLDASYRRAQLPVMLLGGLPVACLLACGPALIALLYDPRYADAGWMLQLLALGAWLQIPQTLSANALMALGVPRWIAIGNGMKLAGMLALLPAGFVLFGVPGAIGGLAAAEVFRYATFAIAVRGVGLPALRADLTFSGLILAGTAAGSFAVDLLARGGSGALLQLLAAVAVIVLLWTPASALLLRSELPGLRERLRSVWRGSAPVLGGR
jgi:O-antigen/teichoic acid export membrane protein